MRRSVSKSRTSRVRQGIAAIPTDGEKNDGGWEAVMFKGIGNYKKPH